MNMLIFDKMFYLTYAGLLKIGNWDGRTLIQSSNSDLLTGKVEGVRMNKKAPRGSILSSVSIK